MVHDIGIEESRSQHAIEIRIGTHVVTRGGSAVVTVRKTRAGVSITTEPCNHLLANVDFYIEALTEAQRQALRLMDTGDWIFDNEDDA